MHRRLLLACLCLLAPALHAQATPWPIRAVIVTTFEIGADTGDLPGELQLWAEREHLTESLPFPGGNHPLLTNPEHTVLAMVSGTTLVNASASTMALGFDPRFDLTRAYWLVNGIAGVDPADASIGSVAWAHYVVSDITRYIDPREAPADWPYGFFPIGAHRPDELPPAHGMVNDRVNAYTLNAALGDWAYDLTKGVLLMDAPAVKEFRAGFTGYPNAQRPPFVLIGDSFAADSYWHGAITTRWANDWVRLFTANRGNFVMTNMEDSAFAEALTRLTRLHRADFSRLLVLRAGSNYSMQRPGHTAVESVTAPYIGTLPALENTWRTGSVVLHQLTQHWERYATSPPSTASAALVP